MRRIDSNVSLLFVLLMHHVFTIEATGNLPPLLIGFAGLNVACMSNLNLYILIGRGGASRAPLGEKLHMVKIIFYVYIIDVELPSAFSCVHFFIFWTPLVKILVLPLLIGLCFLGNCFMPHRCVPVRVTRHLYFCVVPLAIVAFTILLAYEWWKTDFFIITNFKNK